MTVGELIEFLEGFDPDADIYIMEQPEWPFEYSVKGVVTRNDFTEVDNGAARHTEEDSLPGSDVFILEGSQLRYGSSRAWEVAKNILD